MKALPEIQQTPRGPMATVSGGEALTDLLGHLEASLADHGVPTAASFAPGLPAAEIERQLERQGLVANDEIVAWWSWHNGAQIDTTVPLPYFAVPGMVISKLEFCLGDYEYMMNAKGGRPDKVYGGGPGWLRLVRGSTGPAVSCKDDLSAPPEVRFTNQGFRENSTKFRAVSLCTYVTWILMGLENGAYRFYPQTGGWDVDRAKRPASQIEAAFH